MNNFDKLNKTLPQLEQLLGHTFRDKNLLLTACVHSSFTNEYKHELLENNERLEFLGDSILNLVIAELLYILLPGTDEGKLSSYRSALVSAPSCATFASVLQIEEFLLVGKGELVDKGKIKSTLLSDFFEALMGALYLDGGILAVKEFIKKQLYTLIEEKLQNPLANWKADLQEYLQKKGKGVPIYKVLSEKGPDHSKIFEIGVFIDDSVAGVGTGNSKKEAEQMAAEHALRSLQ